MSHTKSAPIANPVTSNNLAGWKAHCGEIHAELLAAGFVTTSDTGQLDIEAVGALPSAGSFSGYKIYAVDDDLAALGYGICMKVEYGAFQETGGSNSYQYFVTQNPYIRVTVGPKTDGAGNILAQDGASTIAPAIQFYCPAQSGGPQGYSGSNFSGATNMYVCMNEAAGFFGFVFACNARGYITSSPSSMPPVYNGSSLSFFIQRTLDANGTPTNEGFTVYAPQIPFSQTSQRYPMTATAGSAATRGITYGFKYSEIVSQSTKICNPHPAGVDSLPNSGRIQFGPCYTFHKELRLNPNLITYRTSDLYEGTQFQVEVSPGTFKNFIALGPGTGIFPDYDVQLISYAMLFE